MKPIIRYWDRLEKCYMLDLCMCLDEKRFKVPMTSMNKKDGNGEELFEYDILRLPSGEDIILMMETEFYYGWAYRVIFEGDGWERSNMLPLGDYLVNNDLQIEDLCKVGSIFEDKRCEKFIKTLL